MARHTLLFYFVQFLSLFASANAGFNATIANCIDFDMANVEELISTLWIVKNPEINAFNSEDEDKENNQPFGYLKTDWSRLQLLQDALPADSLLKDKFKHIFRILLIAHDQATHFFEIRDAVEKQTPILLTNKNYTSAEEGKKNSSAENKDFNSESQKIRAKLKDFQTTLVSVIDEDFIDTSTKSSFYGIYTNYPKSTADDRDAIEMKGVNEVSAELGEKYKNYVPTNTTELDPSMNSSTTIAAPIFIIEAMKSSTADSILTVETTISEEEINISASTHEKPMRSTVTSLSESTLDNEEVISMGQATKIILGIKASSPDRKYIASTTERTLKEIYEVSSDNDENSSFRTIPSIFITKTQLLNSSSSETSLLSTTEQPIGESSLQSSIKMDPVVKSSITKKYPLSSTISSIVPTKSQSFVSTSSDRLEKPSSQKSANISWVQSTTNTLLAEILTGSSVEKNLETTDRSNTQLNSKIRESGASETTKAFTIENISVSNPKIEDNKEIELIISNKETENSSNPNFIPNVWTADSGVNISNIATTLEHPEIKLTTQRNQNQDSTSEISIPKVLNTGDLNEIVLTVTPTIRNNEDSILISENNRSDPPISEKSIANLLTTNSYMEITSDIPMTLEKESESELANTKNDTEHSMDSVQRISNLSPTKNPMEKPSDVLIILEKDRKSKISSPNNQTEYSSDYVEKISNFTTIIKNNEDIANRNNPTEAPINKISTTKNPMEITSDVPITVENERESQIASLNNETENSSDYVERVSNFTVAIKNNKDNKSTSRNNRTETLINEKSTANLSATEDPTENTPNVLIETEHNRKDEISNLNNSTEISLHVNVTLNDWYTTDSIKRTSSVTPKVNKTEDNKLKSSNNQTEFFISENSTINIKETINPSNHITAFTSSISNKKIDSTTEINRKEILVSEKSTPSEWINRYSTESVQIIIPTLTTNEEIKSTTQNDEIKAEINNKSAYNENDSPNSSILNSTVNTPYHSTNTIQFVAETSIPDVSYKIKQDFVSMKPVQQVKTSTQNYISEQSTIITNKFEINIPRDSELKNKPEANLQTENSTNNQNNLEINSNKYDHTTTIVNHTPDSLPDSENWRTNSKPSFVKNPLNIGSSRSNKIFQDFRHGSDDNGPEKNSESPEIVLYEAHNGAKTGSVWRPHLVRQQPAGNNIWRFGNYPKNVGPYNYGYKQPSTSPIDSKIDIRKDEKNPAKFPEPGRRMNLLRSRKRGSANSDVEKQFRWFYRNGRVESSHESREKEKTYTNIKIQCNKANQR